MKQLKNGGAEISPMVFLQTLRAEFPQFQHQVQGVFSQQDAEECYSGLMNALDKKLKLADGTSFIQKYMTGEFQKTLKCIEAPDETPTLSFEPFFKLSCHISQNVNYLSQGLEEVCL